MSLDELLIELREILDLESIDLNQQIEIDSLSALMIVELFRENYDITVDKSIINEFETLNDVIQFISENGQ